MARCYQCGIQTSQYIEGSAVCADCFKKLDWTPTEKSLSELDQRLNEAREEYRRALSLRTEAFELKRSRPSDEPDADITIQNANDSVEIAAMKLRRALRNFVKALREDDA